MIPQEPPSIRELKLNLGRDRKKEHLLLSVVEVRSADTCTEIHLPLSGSPPSIPSLLPSSDKQMVDPALT